MQSMEGYIENLYQLFTNMNKLRNRSIISLLQNTGDFMVNKTNVETNVDPRQQFEFLLWNP